MRLSLEQLLNVMLAMCALTFISVIVCDTYISFVCENGEVQFWNWFPLALERRLRPLLEVTQCAVLFCERN